MSETKSKPYNVSISVAGSDVVYRFNDKQQIVGVDERTSEGVLKPIVPNSADLLRMLIISISIRVITNNMNH